ncbi:MAG: helix-turn-helix domain-containing protein [Terriglobia bacterium]
MKKRTRIRVTEGSGNAFRDLGFPNAEREQLKAHLTLQIYRLIRERDLTQAEAGEILGIKQPHVSGLMRASPGPSRWSGSWAFSPLSGRMSRLPYARPEKSTAGCQ